MYITDVYSNKYAYLRYKVLQFVPAIFRKYFIQYSYKKFYKQNLDLKNPKRLSEKIQWLKINGDKRIKTYLSDKLQVKNYIKKELPELKCANVYQIDKNFKNLNWDKLPQEFILKTNHAWLTNIVIENKYDIAENEYKAIAKFYSKVLKINFAFWSNYEMQYKDIIPYIYAEEYLGDWRKRNEYEIWCFNGNVEFITYKQPIKINKTMFRMISYYNNKWEKQNFYIEHKELKNVFPNGNNKYKVIEYAKILSKDIDFVRVDFMEVNDELYFCEMTFTPFSGYIDIQPRQYDLILGEKLKLDCNK